MGRRNTKLVGPRVPQKMKISRRDNIDRYYLLRFPFGLGGVFLHRVHHAEKQDLFHTHPWSWASIVLGSYLEEVLGRKLTRRRLFNACRAETPHRVVPDRGTVWTVCVHGPRRAPWMVIHRSGRVVDVEPWRGVDGRSSYDPDESSGTSSSR